MNAKPKIIFTIDAEVGDNTIMVDQACEGWFSGLFMGEEFGTQFIAKLLRKYNIQANFFLSVLESYKFGEGFYDKNANKLMGLGHSVDLHTHPIYLDQTRKYMYMYSFDEQKEILRDGLSKIQKWTGRSVDDVVYRAGSYSVNYQSYEAMKDIGITMDSSYYESINCKVWNGYKNHLFLINDVKVFPITSANFNIKKLGFKLPIQKISKLDINQQSISDIILAINGFQNVDYVIIFLHSFSFMRYDKNYKITGINKKLIENFDFLLKYIVENNLETCILQRLESVPNYRDL